MKRILVTGGSGYLGAELVRRALAAEAWDVTATCHAHAVDVPGARLVPLDLGDADAVQKLMADVQPDVVVHTAYVQRGPLLWDVTALGAGRVAEAARQAGARLIHMSSDVVFDGERAGAYTEHDSPSPISPYGEAKVEAERLVMLAHPEALLVRTSLIYGGHEPGIHERLVLDTLDGLHDIAFFSDEMRCPVQVTDLADAVLELAAMKHMGVLNVAGADVVSRYEFAQLIAAAHGRSADALRSARSATSGERRPRNCALDSSVAQQLLRTSLRGARAVLGTMSPE
jgi:dTDP-4-dehydrorhamnose reductase